MKSHVFFIFFILSSFCFSQSEQGLNFVKKIIVKNSNLQIDTISISPYKFKLFTNQKIEIETTKYDIDFTKSLVTFSNDNYNGKTIIVHYQKFPDFLTKTYTNFDENLIQNFDSTSKKRILYQVQSEEKSTTNPLFNGMKTTGYLSRGITMGNNQDGVVNSGLKLQLKGKLSQKISINANITDNNVPLQNNGYTQRLNEYDRVFVEMYSDKWKLTAGDLFLSNTKSNYLNFNKKVAGLGVNVKLKDKKSAINIYTSGAIVKGKFTKVDFKGQEANQGPYRLANNSQQFLLIISDSERVYIDGIPLSKEEYTLDYSSSEITFATIRPINSNMRIHIEFQASEQNYTRFVSYNTVNFQNKKLNFEIDFYSESDSKSKSLQQDLNDLQKQLLLEAGDDSSKMYALSAVNEDYNEHSIQYKKEIISGEEVFLFSNDANDDLYNVRFTYVGDNQGNYNIENTIATGRIFIYTSPISGVKQGNYEPKIQLEAPKKLQVTTFKTNYKNKKIAINSEIAISNQDKNLFSDIDDADNKGIAGNLSWKQILIDKKWQLTSNITYEHINNQFNSVERIKGIEFNRDWNIKDKKNNQGLFQSTFQYKKDSLQIINYTFENLNYSNSFNGLKHSLTSNVTFNKTSIQANASLMKSNSISEISDFSKIYADIKQKYSRFLVGLKINQESNLRIEKANQKLTNLSFKNKSYSSYIEIKDSLQTKLKIGYVYQLADSIKNNSLQNVNKSNNYFIQSNIINNEKANLDVYANYRKYTNSFFTKDQSLNSKINYSQKIANNFIQLNTTYETSSGALPRQEFKYQKVDLGKGYYTWVDYNENGIQDLDEFEIAQFQDEAIYVRVLLPSSSFIRTNQTKFNQLFTINPSQWSTKKSIKKIVSHFINQTNISIQNKQYKKTNFQFNPFDTNDALSLQYNFKNFLFLNRGKQHYSAIYSYLKSDNKTVFITGLLENNLESNQVQILHGIKKTWLVDLKAIHTSTINNNERYSSRNMDLKTNTLQGKLSYLFNNKKSSLHISYKTNRKVNNSENKESLKANDFGLSIQHVSNNNLSLSSSFNYINNDYSSANLNSAIAYQLLEGLQSGKNYTWNLIIQKALTKYLDFNLNYSGRKSKKLKTIHIGSLQLRAKF